MTTDDPIEARLRAYAQRWRDSNDTPASPDWAPPTTRQRSGRILALISAASAAAILGTYMLVSQVGGTEDANPLASITLEGDPAFWILDPGSEVSARSTAIEVLVSRLACNSGITGEILGPQVAASATKITVTFAVSPDSDGGFCVFNDQVPVRVDLGGPIGERVLVDGGCLGPRSPDGDATCNGQEGGPPVRWDGKSPAAIPTLEPPKSAGTQQSP